jgi:hypothetical protein
MISGFENNYGKKVFNISSQYFQAFPQRLAYFVAYHINEFYNSPTNLRINGGIFISNKQYAEDIGCCESRIQQLKRQIKSDPRLVPFLSFVDISDNRGSMCICMIDEQKLREFNDNFDKDGVAASIERLGLGMLKKDVELDDDSTPPVINSTPPVINSTPSYSIDKEKGAVEEKDFYQEPDFNKNTMKSKGNGFSFDGCSNDEAVVITNLCRWRLTKKEGEPFYKSDKQMSSETNLSRSKFRSIKEKLEYLGIFKKGRRSLYKFGTSTSYLVDLNKIIEIGCPKVVEWINKKTNDEKYKNPMNSTIAGFRQSDDLKPAIRLPKTCNAYKDTDLTTDSTTVLNLNAPARETETHHSDSIEQPKQPSLQEVNDNSYVEIAASVVESAFESLERFNNSLEKPFELHKPRALGALRKRMKDCFVGKVSNFEEYLEKIADTPFLMGKSGKEPFELNAGWILKRENIEDSYHREGMFNVYKTTKEKPSATPMEEQSAKEEVIYDETTHFSDVPSKIINTMATVMGKEKFKSWILPAKMEISNGVMTIYTANGFNKDWITNTLTACNMLDRLKSVGIDRIDVTLRGC